ncbi:hypothetical protein ACLOJK_011292 [Asimina triloba]
MRCRTALYSSHVQKPAVLICHSGHSNPYPEIFTIQFQILLRSHGRIAGTLHARRRRLIPERSQLMEAIKRRVVDSELVAFGILLHVKLGKLFGIRRGGQPPFPGGSHKHLSHPGERAPRRLLVPVKRSAREEDRERNSKDDRRNAVAQGQAHVVRYIRV